MVGGEDRKNVRWNQVEGAEIPYTIEVAFILIEGHVLLPYGSRLGAVR
jgi:hypothetical protein